MGATVPEMRLWNRDFSAGLRDTPESDRIPPGATPDAYNGDFDKVDMKAGTATIKKRAGTRLITPAQAANARYDGLFEFRRAASDPVLLGVCNGTLFQFDNVDTMNAVSGGTGFTAGNSARACFFKSNAIIHDGGQNKRYNGTTVFDLGFVKPTSATNITAVAPSGAGVTGTFEAYYVWYDSVMEHESSPSAVTASTTVLVAQARRHTKPGGVPATNVTHWRAYVRRTDTNEFNFFLAATVAVGTASADEELSDASRRDAGAGPYTSDNDPPPGAFAILQSWKGYGIGVRPDDDSYYVSKLGDLESWNPRNRFYVNRGDGESITSVLPFGTDILVHKGHSTYRLLNETLPFKLDPLHSRWGNVSQESGLEVDGKFYGWDRERGPYVTDTVNWLSLVDGWITLLFAQVNRSALGDIRGVYNETTHVIEWAVARTGSTRKRLLFKFHVGLQTWLPPDTGMEYGSLCTFTTTAGELGVYMGDCWGRVFLMGSGDRDGVERASTGVTAVGPIAVTSATSSTVTCSGAAFPTTGAGLTGLSVAVVSATGEWQWRRVESNTATTITLDTTFDTAWTTTPDTTYNVVVGGIRWYHSVPWLDFGISELEKRFRHFFLQGQASSSVNNATVHVRYNDDEGVVVSSDFEFPVGNLSGIWGSMVWGTGTWGATGRRTRKASLEGSAFTVQFVISNYYADQPVTITAYGLTADALPGRKAEGYAE